jgi:hypothetical protein
VERHGGSELHYGELFSLPTGGADSGNPVSNPELKINYVSLPRGSQADVGINVETIRKLERCSVVHAKIRRLGRRLNRGVNAERSCNGCECKHSLMNVKLNSQITGLCNFAKIRERCLKTIRFWMLANSWWPRIKRLGTIRLR